MSEREEWGFGPMGKRQIEQAAARLAEEVREASSFPVGDIELELRSTLLRLAVLQRNEERVRPEAQWQQAIAHEMSVLVCLLNELPSDHVLLERLVAFAKERGTRVDSSETDGRDGDLPAAP